MTAVVVGLVAAIVFIAIRDGLLEYRAGVVRAERDALKGESRALKEFIDETERRDIRAMPFWGKMPSMDAWYVKTLISGHDRVIYPSREELHATMYERFNSTANALLDELYGEVK